jgi:hypothetical protein
MITRRRFLVGAGAGLGAGMLARRISAQAEASGGRVEEWAVSAVHLVPVDLYLARSGPSGHSVRSTRTFITGPPPSACSIPS